MDVGHFKRSEKPEFTERNFGIERLVDIGERGRTVGFKGFSHEAGFFGGVKIFGVERLACFQSLAEMIFDRGWNQPTAGSNLCDGLAGPIAFETLQNRAAQIAWRTCGPGK